jgi:glucose/arabinose dehydrogenase
VRKKLRPDSSNYITESNLEFDPSNLQTRVTAVSPITVTILATDTLSSYAGITWGADGLLYVTNELSGLWVGIDDSVFTVDPITGTRALFTTGLRAPEGLCFTANGGFPLYVAEEDTGGGAGRLSRIETDGSHTPFCIGFGSIEDVAVDDSGRLYVSEDSSGWIIFIEHKVYLPIIMRSD